LGSKAKPLVGVCGKASRNWRHFFVKKYYSEPVLKCMLDYVNQFNVKWNKNQFGGRTVVYMQATTLAHWATVARHAQ